MTIYNITEVQYEEMAERCTGTFSWDCIELENEWAIIFACREGQPYDIEVRNEDDDIIPHDFDLAKFKKAVDRIN